MQVRFGRHLHQDIDRLRLANTFITTQQQTRGVLAPGKAAKEQRRQTLAPVRQPRGPALDRPVERHHGVPQRILLHRAGPRPNASSNASAAAVMSPA
jgi:hypothetical protein